MDHAVGGQEQSSQRSSLGAIVLRRPRRLSELALLAVVYGAYTLSRNAVPTAVAEAEHNGADLLRLESSMGMDIERGLNHAVLRLPALVVGANYYYATLHFIVTGAVLVWLFRRRPGQYARHRRVLLIMTMLALVGYWLYPVAPPRLIPGGGFVDTLRAFGTWGARPGDAVVSASNQYAAMPSMHVGWALWSGATVARQATVRALRIAGACYPALTVLVVVLTANHYLLDAIAAVVVFVAAVVISSMLDGPLLLLPLTLRRALPGRSEPAHPKVLAEHTEPVRG